MLLTVILVSLFSLSHQTIVFFSSVYRGGTMRWKQTSVNFVRFEVKIFDESSSCSGVNSPPLPISFDIIPAYSSSNDITNSTTANITNTKAFRCFNVYSLSGGYTQSLSYSFDMYVAGLSTPFYVWPHSSPVLMFAKVTLGFRKFFNGRSTNQYNESPAAGVFPYLKVQDEEEITFNLPVFDANFDKVKCRLANEEEYGNQFIGNTFPYFQSDNVTIHEDNCTIVFPALSANSSYAIAIMLEDYTTIDEGSSQPMSVVPVQFIVAAGDAGGDGEPKFSQQSDVCRNNSLVTDDKHLTRYGVNTYSEISISPSHAEMLQVETTSTIPIVLNGTGNTSFSGSIVWLVDLNDQYSSVEIVCYAGHTSPRIYVNLECIFLTLLDSNLIEVTIVSPSHSSVQQINGVKTFQVYFHAAISEFTGTGHFQVHRASDNSLVGGKTLDLSCTNDCQFSKERNGLNITLSNTYENGRTYYVNYSIPVAKYCQSPAPLNDPASWTFTTRLFRQTAVSYTQEMKLFTNNAFDTEVGFPFVTKLGDFIFVGIKIAGESGTNALIHRCYATATEDPNDSNFYDIISSGCNKDAETNIISSTYPNLQFSVAAFRFSSTSTIYLHCQTKICMPATDASLCTPNCSSRKKRYVDASELTHLKVGPIYVEAELKDPMADLNIIRTANIIRTTNIIRTKKPFGEKDGNKNNLFLITKETRNLVMIIYSSFLGTILFIYFLFRWYHHHYCL